VLLRPGHITAQQIADVIGTMPRQPDQAAPRASGTLESHYAPKAPVALLPTGDIEKALAELKLRGRSAALIHYSPFVLSQPNVTLPAEPKGYAYGVYAALRAMDQQQVELILVEAPPSDDAWLGVNDRLRRAAFGSTGIIERFLQS
jgi:L-threonylcarbamoyladenylate synthase